MIDGCLERIEDLEGRQGNCLNSTQNLSDSLSEFWHFVWPNKNKIKWNKIEILRDMSELLFLNYGTLSELKKWKKLKPKVIIWPRRSFGDTDFPGESILVTYTINHALSLHPVFSETLRLERSWFDWTEFHAICLHGMALSLWWLMLNFSMMLILTQSLISLLRALQSPVVLPTIYPGKECDGLKALAQLGHHDSLPAASVQKQNNCMCVCIFNPLISGHRGRPEIRIGFAQAIWISLYDNIGLP